MWPFTFGIVLHANEPKIEAKIAIVARYLQQEICIALA